MWTHVDVPTLRPVSLSSFAVPADSAEGAGGLRARFCEALHIAANSQGTVARKWRLRRGSGGSGGSALALLSRWP